MTPTQRTTTIIHVLDSLRARSSSRYGRADDRLSRAMTAIVKAGCRLEQAKRLRAELHALGFQPDEIAYFVEGRCGRINYHLHNLLGSGLSLLK